MPAAMVDVCCSDDSVAKVVLPKVSKILRATGAVSFRYLRDLIASR
jgi:hypothetical protein